MCISMTTQTQMTMRKYFEMGTALANKSGLGAHLREMLQRSTSRSVHLRLLKPHPEIEEVEGWLEKYVEGFWADSARNNQGLVEAAVEEEAFVVFLDPSTNQIHVVEPHQVAAPTVVVHIHYRTAYMIAGRSETCYTAWWKGMPLWTEGDSPVRDMNVIDDILELFHSLMNNAGHDVASLFR